MRSLCKKLLENFSSTSLARLKEKTMMIGTWSVKGLERRG